MATEKIENPFNRSTDPEIHHIFNTLLDLKARVSESFKKSEKIAGFTEDTSFQKPIEANVYPFFIDYKAIYKPLAWPYKGSKSLSEIDILVEESIKSAKDHLAEIIKLNEPILLNNQKIKEQISLIMTRLGITSNYCTYEFPTSRSKNKKSVNHCAGYLSDLNRVCPSSNSYTQQCKLESYITGYKYWAAASSQEEIKKQILDDETAIKTNVLENPDLVATLMQAGVNVLAELQRAVPGKKSEVIKYSMAQAISLEKAKSEPDQALLKKLSTYRF